MGDHDRRSADAPVAAQPAQDQEAIDAFVHPSVGRINALAIDHAQAPIGEITAILRAHPEDYDACMRAIHRLWGNQVAAQCSILVPHISLTPGRPDLMATPPGRPEGESPVSLDASRDGHDGPVDMSASAGPVTATVSAQPSGRDGSRPRVTGGSVEVAGDVGDRTHASGSVGVDTSGDRPSVSADASVTHRVTDRVAVGGTGHVEGTPATGEVRASGGGSVHLQLSDVTALRIAGGVDSNGQLNQEVALEILQDPQRRVPISDEGHRRLRIVLRATEQLPVGQDAQPGGGVTLGIGGTF